jgi:hypothetical protein
MSYGSVRLTRPGYLGVSSSLRSEIVRIERARAAPCATPPSSEIRSGALSTALSVAMRAAGEAEPDVLAVLCAFLGAVLLSVFLRALLPEWLYRLLSEN